jgi:hypothetical protein
MVLRARYYDPSTGEFTSPDPLEYVDGMSLYRGYFVSKTTDPSGLKCEEKCCCCVEGIDINFPAIQLIDLAVAWGHEFKTTFRLNYVKSDKEGDCTIEWWERTDKPYTPTMVGNGPMTWNDMTKDPATAWNFDESWGKRKKPCPDKEDVPDFDEPTIPKWWKTDRRILQFAIVVRSAKDCPCDTISITKFLTQELSVKDFKGDTESIKPGGVSGPMPPGFI